MDFYLENEIDPSYKVKNNLSSWLLLRIFWWHLWRTSDNLKDERTCGLGTLSQSYRIVIPQSTNYHKQNYFLRGPFMAQFLWQGPEELRMWPQPHFLPRHYQGLLWGQRVGGCGALAKLCLLAQNIYLHHPLEAAIVLISNVSIYSAFLFIHENFWMLRQNW